MTSHEAAKVLGISRETLLRWFHQGKIPEVGRDRNGWRVFSEEDIETIRRYAEQKKPPSGRRLSQKSLFG